MNGRHIVATHSNSNANVIVGAAECSYTLNANSVSVSTSTVSSARRLRSHNTHQVSVTIPPISNVSNGTTPHYASPTSSKSSMATSAMLFPTHPLDALLPILLNPNADNRTKFEAMSLAIESLQYLSSNGMDLPRVSVSQTYALYRELRFLILCVDANMRDQSWRLLRYTLNQETTSIALSLHLDILLCRSLERENTDKYFRERVQAFKLIKTAVNSAVLFCSRAIIMSLIAIAEHPKEDFRHIALSTLHELMLVQPELVASCNGIRVLIDAIVDPAVSSLSHKLTLTLIFLLDQESTRRYLRPSLDLARLLAVFTDISAADSPDREARRLASHRALLTLLRSWTGILSLTSDPTALRSVVRVLALPAHVKGASWVREAVLDLILEVMQLVKSRDLLASSAIRHRSGYVNLRPNLLHSYIVVVLLAFIECGLVDVLAQLASSSDSEFRGVCTKLLVEILKLSAELLPRSVCAQLNALPSLVTSAGLISENNDGSARVRSMQLLTTLSNDMSIMTNTANFLLSDTHQMDLLSSMSHASTISNVNGGDSTMRSDRRLNHIFSLSPAYFHSDLYAHTPVRHTIHGIPIERYMLMSDLSEINVGVASTSASILRGNKGSLLSSLYFSQNSQLDDKEIESLVKKTQVYYTKDFRAWDTPLILQLLEGPLTSPVVMASVLTKTKFIKRLCSFLRPEKHFLMTLDWCPSNMRFVRLACSLFKAMLHSPEGREYVYFVKLIEEIFDLLGQEIGSSTGDVPNTSSSNLTINTNEEYDGTAHNMPSTPSMVSTPNSQSFNTVRKLGRNMSGWKSTRNMYVNPLSRFHAGRKLSRAYFLLIGLLSTSRFGIMYFERNNMVKHLRNLCQDYRKDYLTRMLLLHFDYSESLPRNLLETWLKGGSIHLRMFAVSFLHILLRNNPSEFIWSIGVLCTLLTHPDVMIRAAVCSLLEEAAADSTCLKVIIQKKPSFQLLGTISHPLQLLLVSTKAGLDFLKSTGTLYSSLQRWNNGGNLQYVEYLEQSLINALSGTTNNGYPTSQSDLSATSNLTTTNEKLPSSASTTNISIVSPTTLPSNSPNPVASAPNFNFSIPTPRTPLDDYFFARLHDLPWFVELWIETPGGRTKSLQCDCLVYTTPYEYLSRKTLSVLMNEHGYSAATSGANGSTGSTFAGNTHVFVCCIPLDNNNLPCTVPFDPTAIFHARLSLASDAPDLHASEPTPPRTPNSSKASPYYPTSLATSSVYSCRYTTQDHLYTFADSDCCRWNFASPGNEVHLESIVFPVPLPSSFIPTVTLPKHMFGELGKTPEGCNILRHHANLSELVAAVRIDDRGPMMATTPSTNTPMSPAYSPMSSPSPSPRYGSPIVSASGAAPFLSPSSTTSSYRRAALWALGNIG